MTACLCPACAARPQVERPLLVDWYACEGAGALGQWLAGFDVVVVDLFKHDHPTKRDKHGKPVRVGFSRARNPFPALQADCLAALDELLAGGALPFTALCGRVYWYTAEQIAAHTGSPPCQHASAGTRAMRAQGKSEHPALIEPTRDRFAALGRPYIIENVKGAALRDPITLCWSMFYDPHVEQVRNEDGVLLRMERHRLFESNIPLAAPGPCWHPDDVQVAGAYGAAQRTIEGAKARGGGYVPSKAVQARLLGVDWMTEGGMHQCLPPVYTKHLGQLLLAHLDSQEAAA